MSKRNLFDELSEGFDALKQQRQGKVTLATHQLEELPALTISPEVIRATRDGLGVSRGVFARQLRVSLRTLENWEQGRARPNPQAAALILMVREYPDTFQRLRTLDNVA